MQSVQTWLCRLFLVLILCAFVQCANRGNPSGGPKDVTPPSIVKSHSGQFFDRI